MRVRASAILILLAANLLAGCFRAEARDPDEILYHNAQVWTADPEQPEAQAFVVKDGVFTFVGTLAEARSRHPRAHEVNLAGLRVTPGLVDSHSHFLRVAVFWKCDRETPRFDPVFDNSDLATIEFEISRLQRAQYHYQTNLSGRTPVDDQQAIVDRQGAKRGIECGNYIANAMGLTGNVEAGISSWDYQDVLRELEAEQRLTLRHHLYLTPPLLQDAIQRGVRTGNGTDWVRVAGIKFYSDGWLGPRTSAVLVPYNDRPGSRGVLFLQQAEADSWVQTAHEAGLKPATHTIGDQGVATLLNAYEKQANASTARFTFEHGSVVQPRDIERMGSLGAVVSYQLSFATSDQRFVESALGPERVKLVYPWKTMLEANVTLAGGSDFPIETLHPLWGLQRVVTRQELDGTPPGGWFPAQRLSVHEALTTITRNAAYNVFFEDRGGQVRSGLLADFVVYSQDVLAVEPSRIASVCVEKTFVGGRIVYDRATNDLCERLAYRGELPRMDEAAKEALEARLRRDNLNAGLRAP